MRSFIEWTAWEMVKPEPYGAFHILWVLIAIPLCTLAAWKLRKLDEKGNRILLLSVGIFLAICELYKQLFYYYHIGNGSYQWWIFPFQMCSVPMYLCMIAPILKSDKVKSGMYHFMMIYNLMGGFMSFVEPSGLVHGYWTLTLHAFIWHTLLIFVGLYLGFSGYTSARKQDFKLATLTLLCLCILAFVINLLFWDVSGGSINMFFLGPKNSSLAVFKDISERFGWYFSTLLYIPAMILGGFLVFLPFHLVKKKS